MYRSFPGLPLEQVPVPGPVMAKRLVERAIGFLEAAMELEGKDYPTSASESQPFNFRLIPPRLHLLGQAVELAFKAKIKSAGGEPPRYSRGHDLGHLMQEAARHGAAFSRREIKTVAYLSHEYFQDHRREEARYATRYPSDSWERVGGTIPSATVIHGMVRRLCGEEAASPEGRGPEESD